MPSALGFLCVLGCVVLATPKRADARPVCLDTFLVPAPQLPKIKQVSFIVPVYRELENGNIQAFLKRLDESARSSTKTNSLQVSAVFAVNNTVEVAADPQSLVWRENQKTLDYLEKEKLSSRHPYSIRVVNLSTEGTERNMGVIRETAVTRLLESTQTPTDQHVLVHMDVDTKLPPLFFENLFKAYEQNREAVFFARSYELRDELRTALVRSHPDYKRKRAWRDLQILLGDLHEGVATYQISSRASTHLKIGGFKPLIQGEDTQLSKDLLAHPHALDSQIVVATEDRSRPDGFTSARRREDLNGLVPRKKLFPRLLFLEPWIDRAEELVRQGRVTEAIAQSSFESLVKSESGVDLAPLALPSTHLRERYKRYLYETSETPAQAAYDSFVSQLPPGEKSLFDKSRDARLKKLAETETRRQSLLSRLILNPNVQLTAAERRFVKNDPFIKWIKAEGFAELGGFLENGKINLEKLRAQEPAFADWVAPTDNRSVFREHASLVALYDGIARIGETPSLAPVAAAKLQKLREGPK